MAHYPYSIRGVLGQGKGEEKPRTISQCGVPANGKCGLHDRLGAGLTVRDDRLGSSRHQKGWP